MRKLLFLIIISSVIVACKNNIPGKMKYPETKKVNVVDTIFGTPVPDPYRWLEDDRSDETAAWVKAQNAVTFGYLGKIPYRDKIREQLTDMFNFEKYGLPFNEGDYTYFTKNTGLQNQYVYYRQKGDGEPELFLDPNTFSSDGTTSLGEMGFSKDGSMAAYTISEGGSDWRKLIVINALTKQVVGDTLKDIKFTGIAWKGNNGFYYSTYDKPKGSELTAMTDHHKLYYHKVGTKQADDKLIFGADKVRRYVAAYLTEDERYLVVTAANSTTGNELYIMDLTSTSPVFRTITGNFESNNYVIASEGTKLFIVTDLKAPNNKIVTADAANPVAENWKDFIPETENVLQPSTESGYIFANYLADAISKVKQFDMNGKLMREISLPGPGFASGFSGKKEDKSVFFSFTNYITPATIYKMDPASGSTAVFKKPSVKFNGDDYISKQVFYYDSQDGTRIPMIITYSKNTRLDGKNPTLLYGYGGFSISMTPAFSISVAWWLQHGGIYAVPNIRGGGEYGEKWHLAGTKMNKQNVFNDFISAAQYLISCKYTSEDYLAVRGGSNGGLLIGAVMTQHPELFRVTIPEVGVMDMLRYHKFTAGAGWAYDFGTADDSPEMFRYIYGYSPVNNVKDGVKYPATLVTTGDHDDRVVPAHSFKFAAQLQAKQAGILPVLIRIETKAGHGAGKPVSMTIQEYADIYSFTLWNMGIKDLK